MCSEMKSAIKKKNTPPFNPEVVDRTSSRLRQGRHTCRAREHVKRLLVVEK